MSVNAARAAEIVGKDVRTITNWIHSGRLKADKSSSGQHAIDEHELARAAAEASTRGRKKRPENSAPGDSGRSRSGARGRHQDTPENSTGKIINFPVSPSPAPSVLPQEVKDELQQMRERLDDLAQHFAASQEAFEKVKRYVHFIRSQHPMLRERVDKTETRQGVAEEMIHLLVKREQEETAPEIDRLTHNDELNFDTIIKMIDNFHALEAQVAELWERLTYLMCVKEYEPKMQFGEDATTLPLRPEIARIVAPQTRTRR